MVWILVFGCAEDKRPQHIWGFPLYHWIEKGRFPTLQPQSKTKLSVQA